MPCVFCQRNEPLSAEHVFPRWTQPFLAESQDDEGTHTRITIRAGQADDTRSHRGKPATLTVRSVCADCNNGWMSRLEEQAKPYLLTMIRGHGRTYYEHGQALIATWLVKTALVAGSKFTPLLPAEIYRQLYDDLQPSDNTIVWLARTPYEEMHYTDFRPIRTHPDESPPPATPNSYSALLAVGQLAGFVVSWLDAVPSTATTEENFGPALVQAWPRPDGTATWPPRGGALDFDQLDALADTVVAAPDVRSGRGRPNR